MLCYVMLCYVILWVLHVKDWDFPVLKFDSYCSSATKFILRGRPAELAILFPSCNPAFPS